MRLNLKTHLMQHFSATLLFLTRGERMKLLLITFCCFSAVCTEASDVLEVRGHVGGNISIPCFGSWIKDDSSEHTSMYFCKGACENTLIQADLKSSAVTQKGRYRIEFDQEDGVFTVGIKKLRKADAGRYFCGMKKSFNVSHQEVDLTVEDASTVPPGSSASPKTNLKIDEVSQPQSSFPSSTEASAAAAFTLPSSEKKNQKEANDLTDTVVVIIVSGSLAFLVCAIIPLIFYKHWRSNADQDRPAAVKAEDRHCEESVVSASTQVEVGLQSLDHPESSPDDNVQYATVYEGLDPKMID